ncbi:hypothetical protein L208DRAFT_1378906 [Tricholoma matsutake]|nr:hypothetical protein L208DRAFT_1378906 [Tricholoma matsutake 945]
MSDPSRNSSTVPHNAGSVCFCSGVAKQHAVAPECVKIKTEKALYTESIKLDAAHTNIEDDEDVLKSPFPGTKGLQPEDDTFSAADATTDKQTVKGAIKGINTAGCKSDTFESVQNSNPADEDPSMQVMAPSLQDKPIVW